MPEAFPLEPSLWAATAAPAISTPAIESSRTADVCVVGGGYAGLSTALHLAERGVGVVLLEAREPGWGGSGRNGGQVIPSLKYDPDEIETMLGVERGRRLIAFAAGTTDLVFDLIARHRMDVPHARQGWIQAAHSPAGVTLAEKRAEQWRRRGVAGARTISKDEADRLLGSRKYLGGWIDPRGGAIQPLSYARGLARAAVAAGAVLHGQSPVTAMTRQGGAWQVTTARGATVTAERVILCTNAYSKGLVAQLENTIIAPHSYAIATEPLPDDIRRTVLPEGHVSSDTRNLLLYFRLDDAGRFIIGGRGPFREPIGDSDWSHLERALGKLFPQIQGVRIAYRWCGRVAVTRDFLPHLHEPEPGLLIDIGCMGRGVGTQTAIGKAMADYVTTGRAEALPLPLTPIRPIPLHQLRRAYLAAYIAWYRLLDGRLR